MANILNCKEIKKAYAARPLFDGITMSIEKGERIGLIGPNGAGKSTLLRILADLDTPDDGFVSRQRGLRIGMLDQVPEFKPDATVEEAIIDGVKATHDWEHISSVREYMSRLSLDGRAGISGDTSVENLSGGWKKRVALARLFVGDHDLILLDEPTNHLDVESILWLEDFLATATFAAIIVTHDRLFLQRVVNRMWELDRRNPGGLLSINGTYADYLESKELLMAGQVTRETTLKNTLRRETEWLRSGVKARGTKQNARIKQAAALKEEVEELEYRNKIWRAKLDFQSSERNPKKLIEAKGISKSYDDRTLFNNVDLLITPGTCLGLLGANGCGKTTLIRTLVGKETPDTGTIKHSDNLKIVYFDQNRETLDPKATVAETLSPHSDHVTFRGNFIHIRGYLDRFNFTQTQASMKVDRLSGGEQSRLLIAKLMLKEANVLVLDEPTNDLDMPTLEVLEQCLLEFSGAIILVTHDRYFLDQVANKLIAFGETDGPNAGLIASFASLKQWERAYTVERAAKRKREIEDRKKVIKTNQASTTQKKRRGFKEQYEFERMEQVIHDAETRLENLQAKSILPEIASNAEELTKLMPEIAELESEIDHLYKRWAELESMEK